MEWNILWETRSLHIKGLCSRASPLLVGILRGIAPGVGVIKHGWEEKQLWADWMRLFNQIFIDKCPYRKESMHVVEDFSWPESLQYFRTLNGAGCKVLEQNKRWISSGADEMAWLVKCLLCKHKDLSSIPRIPVKYQDWESMLAIPSLRRQRQEDP